MIMAFCPRVAGSRDDVFGSTTENIEVSKTRPSSFAN
jgi:hypothetical protein